MSSPNLDSIIGQFRSDYDEEAKNRVWKDQSDQFKKFWSEKVRRIEAGLISDDECDKVIRILDRNGKGSNKNTESVAKAMIPQGAWRRMLNEFRENLGLGEVVTRIFEETDPFEKGKLIDQLYLMNEGQRNNLTGPSGNAICALLVAYDPFQNLSIISLRDRRALSEFLDLKVSFDWESASIGTKICETNTRLLDGLRSMGLGPSARTGSEFCYYDPMKTLWKGENTVKRADKDVSVVVPVGSEIGVEIGDRRDSASATSGSDELRESMQIQALLSKIGARMGFTIWLPKADRGRVLTAWKAESGELVDRLPLGYDATTMKTIEQIDVIWLKKRTIARAFEVEHTTSVYSGLLRMADLVALQPNINIKLHIVAPLAKRDKVIQEIQRPVFTLLEGRPLNEICTFLSYDSISQIAHMKHLEHMSDNVIADFEEKAGRADDEI